MTDLSRRTLLKGAGVSAAAAVLAACGATPAATTAPVAEATAAGGEAAATTAPAAEATATTAPAAAGARQQVSMIYYTSTTPAIARMEKQEAGFKELYPNIDLTVIQEPSDPDAKLRVMWAAGTEPNIMWAGVAAMGFASEGVLAPIDDLVKGDASFDLTAYYPQIVDGFTFDGKLYALPYGATTSVWFYNKALFDAKGIAYPTDDWKLADFRDAALALTEGDVYGVGDLWVYIGNFMAGGRAWDEGYTKSAINTPDTLTALQWNYDLRVTDKAIPAADVLQEQGAIAMFQNQKAGMITLGRWGLPDSHRYPGLRLGHRCLPHPGDRQAWHLDVVRGLLDHQPHQGYGRGMEAGEVPQR